MLPVKPAPLVKTYRIDPSEFSKSLQYCIDQNIEEGEWIAYDNDPSDVNALIIWSFVVSIDIKYILFCELSTIKLSLAGSPE